MQPVPNGHLKDPDGASSNDAQGDDAAHHLPQGTRPQDDHRPYQAKDVGPQRHGGCSLKLDIVISVFILFLKGGPGGSKRERHYERTAYKEWHKTPL